MSPAAIIAASSDAMESRVTDYIALLKPRVMTLVVFSGFAGLVLAPGEIHPFIAAIAVLCIALGSGAAGAINMWYDRDIDAIMKRTANRPIPAGRITPEGALEFGVVMAFASVFLMAVAVNYFAALLLLTAILFYTHIYTMWLKRRTPQNIVIGGAAGAFPPVIGWAAVTENISVEPLVLFLIIFLWTPPHFWALALCGCKDYAKANIPMLPVVAGEKKTKRQMLFYTLLLIPVTLLPAFIGTADHFYFIAAAVLNSVFLYHAVRVYRTQENAAYFAMFKFSVLYLFLLFAALMLDKAL